MKHPRRVFAAPCYIMTAWLGCSKPPAAIVPDSVGPPTLASNDCEPPYPMSFAQDLFFFADLDADRTCPQFIEQDRCILGIFSDCTADDGQGNPDRQWTGRVDTRGAERTVQLVGTTAGATVVARSPACCEGTLMPATGGPVEWSLLQCRLNRCGNTRDVAHVGVYFERLRPDLDPGRRLLDPIRVGEFAEGPVWIGERQELWLLGNGRIDRVPVNPGPPLESVDISGDGGDALIVGSGVVFAASHDQVTRIGVRSLQTQPIALGGPVRAMALTSIGLLVAYGSTASDDRSDLALLSAAGEILVTTSVEGRVSDLAPLEGHPDIAVLGREGEPNLMAVSPDLTPRMFLDFTDSGAEDVTVLDMVEVPPVPGELVGLPEGWVGFVERCNHNVPSPCWFEVSDDRKTLPVRVGVPSAVDLGPVWYDRVQDRVVVSGGPNGLMVVINRNPMRPHLHETIELGSPLSGLTGVSMSASCTETSTAYAYLRNIGEVRPVRLSGFCPG